MVTRKLSVGLVQINSAYSGRNYFPLSAGLLQAYACKTIGNSVEFQPIIYSRRCVNEIVEQLVSVDVAGFSVYVWNFRISLAIAEKLKLLNPNVLVVFGGPHIPNRQTEDFLRQYRFIDVVCHGEGEVIFSQLLAQMDTDWNLVPSLNFIADKDRFIQTPKSGRIQHLDELPSPYLTGVFNPLLEQSPGEHWVGLWETNRGCPFTCSWCDWGHSSLSKIFQWSMERLDREIEWFAKNKIEFILCVDANFGLLHRDVEIARCLAEAKQKFGFPQAISNQSIKNIGKHSFLAQKILTDAGMNKAVTMSVQSMHQPTLRAVRRVNISNSDFRKYQKLFNENGIETVTDMILAQPKETFQSWVKGVDTLLNLGQHGRIYFINLSVLPNSEMGDPAYQKKYGIQTVESGIVNNHGSLPRSNEIVEIQKLVIATNTTSRDDWIRVRVFSWMASLLHFDKIFQVPIIIFHQISGISYGEILEFFSEGKYQDLSLTNDFPILDKIRQFFTDKAKDIQDGGYEFCHSSEWLDIFWPADEYILIGLCVGSELDNFYNEARRVLLVLSDSKGIKINTLALDEAIRFNKELVKLPFITKDAEFEFSHNVGDFYRSVISGQLIPFEKKRSVYRIDRTQERWSSWNEWLEKVIWFGHRKGAYLYGNRT